MTQLRRKPEFYTSDDFAYQDDVAKLRGMLNRAGYEAPDADIRWAWEEYSDSMCAGWLIFDDDNEEGNVRTLLCFLEPDTDGLM